MNSAFEKWFSENYPAHGKTSVQIALYQHVQAAYKAGMLHAAEIAESRGSSWEDSAWNNAVQDIENAIRKEAGK